MVTMVDSAASSDLSEPPSIDSEPEDQLSTAVPSSRPSVDITAGDAAARPAKRRKTGGHPASLAAFDERAPSSQPPEHPDHGGDDAVSVSSDDFSDAPDEPNVHDEWTLSADAQRECLWKGCEWGPAHDNDELVKHVQTSHCATGGPKKTKYVCEWGECQRKTSNHPSGYALKAHMRSHTKEKPYYCALPECDKAFTRSDALAKHMRTVHEPEVPRGAATQDGTTSSGKKSIKIKLTNGASAASTTNNSAAAAAAAPLGPAEDEDGNPITPSPDNDNIQYIPAFHPITGQPGFMIQYPSDTQFTTEESSISADDLMRRLRRQVHWAQKESEDLKEEIAVLEQERKQEWLLKEILLEGVLEAELAQAERTGLLAEMDESVREAMEQDVQPAKRLPWAPGAPRWRHTRPQTPRRPPSHRSRNATHATPDPVHAPRPAPDSTPQGEAPSTSPPRTGQSGGFEGDQDPYDNYVGDRMAEFERLRAEKGRASHVPQTPPPPSKRHEVRQAEAEADAVGALIGMSGGTA